jgi:hypothetical protein
MDKSLKFIYLSNLIEEYIQHYEYLLLELNKINVQMDINEEYNNVIKYNKKMIITLNLILNKLK